jgi:serine/threonine-protein kinase HipA
MCQLSERLTEHKYKGSYEQIAKLLMRFSYAPKLDLVNYWQQILFCWLTGNSDMHLKNFSLYMPLKGQYFLTPAYDMLSTTLVIPDDTEELALTLNGKKNRLSRNDFEKAFLKSGLDTKVISNLFLRFEKGVHEWQEFIKISFLNDEFKEEYSRLIMNRWNMLKCNVHPLQIQ